jgi:integrase
MTRLTPATARDMKPGEILRDHEVSGLQLRANGKRKSWMLYYRARNGQERRPRIGHFPEMNLASARELAKELKMRIAQGQDPSADWSASRDVPTVEETCNKYLQVWEDRQSAAAQKRDRQLIQAQIIPGLGKRRVDELTTDMIDRFIANVHDRKYVGGEGTAHWTARHTKGLLAKILRRVPKWFDGVEMRADLMLDTKSYERKIRRRHATMDEIPVIAEILHKLAETYPRRAACFWTLFLTGGRVSEIRNLRGSQIQDRQIKQPDGTMKTVKVIMFLKHKTEKHIGAKEVVLPEQAAAILATLPPMKPTEKVFEDISLRRLQAVWEGIREEAGCPDLKMLDARRTFASFALSSGITLDQVGELLGHTDTQTTAGYAFLIEEAKHRSAGMAAAAIVAASNRVGGNP